MTNQISIRTNLLTPTSEFEFALLPDHVVSLDNGIIADIRPAELGKRYDLELLGSLAIPGLIDMHVHLSQHRVKGLYRDALLPWLNDAVFPEEARSAAYDFAYELAVEFFQALYQAGTTTAVIYTAPFRAACEAAFEAARLADCRALIGMTLMDQNGPDVLLQDRKQIQQDCDALISEYHDPDSGLQFIFTPRFAPACSPPLMQWIGSAARQNGLWIQTHLSENKDEVRWVQELFGLDSYTAVYEKAGLLTERTLLAHCIHLSDPELDLILKSGSRIVHCPDSNFFLRSGQFPLASIKHQNIPFALGSDVGAGTTLNMLYHAKMYNYRQSETPVTPADAFFRVTLGAAKILGLEKSIGSLEKGKEADLVLLELPQPHRQLTPDILSQLIFTGHGWKVRQVFSKGIRRI